LPGYQFNLVERDDNLIMNTEAIFLFNQSYHVYNRTNNKEKLFLTDENRRYFLRRYKHYLGPFLDIHGYALMDNHFHFCIKIKSQEAIDTFLSDLPENEKTLTISRYLQSDDKEYFINNLIIGQHHRFFISYVQAFNKRSNRYGNLLHKKFKRSVFDPHFKFKYMQYYIHHNGRKHGITSNFKNYKWTSYKDIVNADSWIIKIEYIYEHFGGLQAFVDFHEASHYEDKFQGLIIENNI
jgi:REP element-mobilizing transposase RayT